MQLKNNLFIASLIGVMVLFTSATAFAHGGHGKAEIQFKITPKQTTAPAQPVIKIAGLSAGRAEFFNYIQSVGAFQMKADLLQRDFLLHYWVAEGLSRYYPTDINDLMPRLMRLGPSSPEYKQRIDEWVLRQADLYGRLMLYNDKAVKAKRDRDPAVVAVLNTYAQHAKGDFLEDLVSFGDFEPTIMGLRTFIVSLKKSERANIEAHYRDPDAAHEFQRKEVKKRWIKYRQDLQKNTKYERLFEKIDSLNVSPDTPIAMINGTPILLRDFLAVYGPIPNDTNWNNIKQSRVTQMAMAIAMADEVDHLGVLSERYKNKIAVAKILYLASDQVVHEFGPATLNELKPKIDFQFFRDVVKYTNLVQFEKIFLTESVKTPAYGDLWIDKEYLAGLEWKIEKAFTPQQASYF